MPADSRVDAVEWERWGIACLRAQDFNEDDARCLAASLTQTSLWGIDSHGMARLPHYLNRVAHGSILARPAIRVDRTGPGLQFVEMLQPAQAAQVARVVDHGLDPQRPPVLQILFDAGVPVEGVALTSVP